MEEDSSYSGRLNHVQSCDQELVTSHLILSNESLKGPFFP